MKTIATKIPEVIILEPRLFEDERGFFVETWNRKKFKEIGIDEDFVQDNHSKSPQGTLRGLHYQIQHTQGKLVRVIAGEVFDIAVDIRKSSPTFGQWVGVTLSAANKKMLWVPPGFAHGFYVTSESAEFTYKCTNFYAPEYERSILWNDPDIGIDWPIVNNQAPLLSPKDKNASAFKNADLFQ
jgi:dTDP-4-dehydrorhamnose 3,5-epimerase